MDRCSSVDAVLHDIYEGLVQARLHDMVPNSSAIEQAAYAKLYIGIIFRGRMDTIGRGSRELYMFSFCNLLHANLNLLVILVMINLLVCFD